jgi:hypothetical protein
MKYINISCFAHKNHPHGGGNLRDPKTNKDCFRPFTQRNLKPKDFQIRVPFQDLLIKRGIFLAEGTNNKVYKTTTKEGTICHDDANIIPLVLRRSQDPLSQTDPEDRRYFINEFVKENKIQIKLQGIMPDLYMFGTYIDEDDKKEYLFSIMYRGTDLHTVLHNFVGDKSKLLALAHKQIEALGKHYCNIDIKPSNMVVSNLSETTHSTNSKPTYSMTPTTKVLVIDVDPYFVLKMPKFIKPSNTKPLNILIMKYLFYKHLNDTTAMRNLCSDPHFPQFIEIFDHLVKQLPEGYDAPGINTHEYYGDDDEALFKVFVVYQVPSPHAICAPSPAAPTTPQSKSQKTSKKTKRKHTSSHKTSKKSRKTVQFASPDY